MSEHATRRARDKIARLAGQGLDLPTFWRESADAVARVVPHYTSPCWHTLDPASLLVTSHYQTELPELPPEWLAHEYFADDVHKFADVARSERGISTLHEVTGGDPSRSPGWLRYIQPLGGDQELLVALRTRTGMAWGMLGLYREPDRPLFPPTNSVSCMTWRRIWPRAPGAGSSWARRPSLTDRRRRGWSSCGRTGASSR